MNGLKMNTDEHIVHLARLGLLGERQQVEKYVRRILRRIKDQNSKLAEDLVGLLATPPSAAAPLRDAGGSFAPVDQDSRLQLLRHEYPIELRNEPILHPKLRDALEQVIQEQNQLNKLTKMDVVPTRTLLFVGPPGVGKTMCARWLAHTLDKPLLTLDLSTVMSSFLGRTGANLRNVLDYARDVDGILLLDEFDAIAKRRDDDTELGELKRLVTILLQEIDYWPSDRILIAATNHGDLLDPAIWRRFDQVMNFPLPELNDVERSIELSFDGEKEDLGAWKNILKELWYGNSYSDIERTANQIRRRAIIEDLTIPEAISKSLSFDLKNKPLATRKKLGLMLRDVGFSDRRVSDVTGLSRDTLRKMRDNT